eukprot:GILI01016878.1.p1 GENE.GILI01016878.1~~GILI01016878.1.p1  ORF type:complete len:123 (+),score=22.49 GILI01016878.1:58-426(+)
MSSPDWSKDEQSLEQAKEYLRQGNTVDFFEAISASILRDQPQSLERFCFDITKGIQQGNPPKTEGEFSSKEEDGNKYMRSHNLSEFLDKWILALLSERPTTDEERVAFHVKYLERLVADAKQ